MYLRLDDLYFYWFEVFTIVALVLLVCEQLEVSLELLFLSEIDVKAGDSNDDYCLSTAKSARWFICNGNVSATSSTPIFLPESLVTEEGFILRFLLHLVYYQIVMELEGLIFVSLSSVLHSYYPPHQVSKGILLDRQQQHYKSVTWGMKISENLALSDAAWSLPSALVGTSFCKRSCNNRWFGSFTRSCNIRRWHRVIVLLKIHR